MVRVMLQIATISYEIFNTVRALGRIRMSTDRCAQCLLCPLWLKKKQKKSGIFVAIPGESVHLNNDKLSDVRVADVFSLAMI